MKKHLLSTLMAIGILGGLMVSTPAMACTPNDPHYHSCVYHNIILPQMQQQQSGSSSSGYNRPTQPRFYTQCELTANRHKLCYAYWRSNGDLFSVEEYDGNGEQLWAKIFDESGQVSSEQTYINNEVSTNKVYSNGVLIADEKFVNGVQDGEQRYYYRSGKSREITLYTQGYKYQSTFFDEQGQKDSVFDYGPQKKGETQVLQITKWKNGEAVVYKPNRWGKIVIDGKTAWKN